MECEKFEKLEQEFIGIRTRARELTLSGKLTAELTEKLAKQELCTLFRLIDHKAEHGCQNSN